MTDTNNITCKRCGRQKTAGGSGSLTQWIVACRCEIIPEKTDDAGEKLESCSKCGKRVARRREGSFTQWVLRGDTCSCNTDIASVDLVRAQRMAIAKAQGESWASQSQRSLAEDEGETDTELEISDEHFPKGRYKPLAEIGHGAAGRVYLCRDRLLNKRVALKSLRSVNAELLIGFQREAKATSQLQHPGVVRVFDFGTAKNGAPYMVMEYVAGASLETYIEENGPLPVNEAVAIFAQIADALGHAHERGIFHRDLKSSNVLIEDSKVWPPITKIIDFGIAQMKQLSPETSRVQGVTIAGTPAYMPPDQVQGRKYDERSEVYSLGCLMFETLTGSVPFQGESALEVMNKHAHDEIPSLAKARAETTADGELPGEIEKIVARCLAKNPNERYATMRELTNALDQFAQQQMPELGYSSSFSDVDLEQGNSHFELSERSGASTVFVIVGGLAALGLSVAALLFVQNRTSEKPYAPRALAPSVYKVQPLVPHADFGTRALIKNMLDKESTEFSLTNDFSPVTDDDLKLFEHYTKARVVDLMGQPITDRGLSYFKKCKKLRRLTLMGTKVKTLDALKDITSLDSLNVDNTQVGDDALKNLSGANGLEIIKLRGSNVTFAGLSHLAHLPKLRKVELADLRIPPSKEQLLSFIKRYPDCQFVSRYSVAKDLTNFSGLKISVEEKLRRGGLAADLITPPKSNEEEKLLVTVLLTLGHQYNSQKNYAESSKLFTRAAALTEKRGDAKFSLQALANVVSAQAMTNASDALMYKTLARVLKYKSLPDFRSNAIAYLLNRPYSQYVKNKEWEKARRWALAILDNVDQSNPALYTVAKVHLSQALRNLGRPAEAVAQTKSLDKFYQQQPDQATTSRQHVLIAEYWRNLMMVNEPEKALKVSQRGLDLIHGQETPRTIAGLFYRQHANTLRALGRKEEAAKFTEQAVKFSGMTELKVVPD